MRSGTDLVVLMTIGGGVLFTLFSAGGTTNNDLPPDSTYREVSPIALSIRHRDGVSTIAPMLLDYARYNDPQYNAFFRQKVGE